MMFKAISNQNQIHLKKAVMKKQHKKTLKENKIHEEAK